MHPGTCASEVVPPPEIFIGARLIGGSWGRKFLLKNDLGIIAVREEGGDRGLQWRRHKNFGHNLQISWS